MSIDSESRILDLVIPVFNNAESLREVNDQIISVVYPLVGNRYSIIYVDDGSKDESFAILSSLQRENPATTTVIKLQRNYGQLAALFAGYDMSSANYTVTISADLQDDASKILNMYQAAIIDGYEIAVCFRESRSENLYRKLTSQIAYRIARLGYKDIPLGGFDYFLMSNKAKNILCLEFKNSRFLQGSVMDLGFPIAWVGYNRQNRKYGKSQWSFRKKVRLLLDILFQSSYLPLRFLTFLGAVSCAGSFLFILDVIIEWSLGRTPFNGFAIIVILISFYGGLTLLAAGIIGEYIVRILEGTKSAKYRVKEILFDSH